MGVLKSSRPLLFHYNFFGGFLSQHSSEYRSSRSTMMRESKKSTKNPSVGLALSIVCSECVESALASVLSENLSLLRFSKEIASFLFVRSNIATKMIRFVT